MGKPVFINDVTPEKRMSIQLPPIPPTLLRLTTRYPELDLSPTPAPRFDNRVVPLRERSALWRRQHSVTSAQSAEANF